MKKMTFLGEGQGFRVQRADDVEFLFTFKAPIIEVVLLVNINGGGLPFMDLPAQLFQKVWRDGLFGLLAESGNGKGAASLVKQKSKVCQLSQISFVMTAISIFFPAPCFCVSKHASLERIPHFGRIFKALLIFGIYIVLILAAFVCPILQGIFAARVV